MRYNRAVSKLRRLVVLLLSLAVPTYGFAAQGSVKPPCEMQMSTDADEAGDGDCCDGPLASAQADSTCAMTPDCHAGHLMPSFPAVRATTAIADTWAAPLMTAAPPGLPVAAVWHPPRYL